MNETPENQPHREFEAKLEEIQAEAGWLLSDAMGETDIEDGLTRLQELLDEANEFWAEHMGRLEV